MELGQKQITFGAFCISVLVHFVILLIIGGFILIEAPIQHETPVGTLDVAPSPNLPPEESKPDTAQDPTLPDPDQELQPNVTQNMQPDAPNVIISPVPTQNYTMLAGTGQIVSGISAPNPNGGGNSGTSTGQKSAPHAVGNPFGRAQMLKGGLTGTFYDLKQDPARKPTQMDPGKPYIEALSHFAKNFDESVLKKYYSSPNPLYTSQIFIPMMGAGAAPEAFHVEDLVKPSMWVVLYKGAFAAPETGSYRFVGYADDVIIVNVDHRVVMDGSRPDMGALSSFKRYDPARHGMANGEAAYGTWLHLNAGENHDIQVLIGERPGGFFGAFLLVQKQGAVYPKDTNGRPIIPIFKMAVTDDSELNSDVKVAPESPIFAPSSAN